MFKIYDGREYFYQWDLNRKLIVFDEKITEVHFCNKTDGNSLVCEVYTDGELRLVNVPNILLQDNWRINVYGYDNNYTKHSKQFDVKSRTKPADYIYTETEVKQWETLDLRIAALEKGNIEIELDGYATEEYVQNTINTEIPNAVNTALAKAEASGEFDGVDGYTPIKGVDYYTSEDKAEFENYITDELAKKGQIYPEFAKTIDECVDTSKMYVLSDGYIYAFMMSTGIKYTNVIDTVGYTSGKYVSGNALGGDATTVATGVFPYNCNVDAPPTIYFKGVDWTAENTHCRIVGYSDLEGTTVTAIQQTSGQLASYWNLEQLGNQYYKISPLLNDSGKWIAHDLSEYVKNVAALRMSFVGTGENLILTLDEPIEDGIIYKWTNTGHAFTPADYESRIIDLEYHTNSLDRKIDEVNVNANGVPMYITLEAERVADLIQLKRTAGSLTFTTMSDAHVFVGTTADWLKPNEYSVRDAGLGLAELRKHITLDLVAMLGDYTYGAGNCTIKQLKKDLQYYKDCMSEGCNGIPNIWATGNHDINYGALSDRRMTEDELYAYIGSNNVGTIQDNNNIGRNYGYIDFENQRIRCVYLNGVDALDYPDNTGIDDDAGEITAILTQWIIDTALNLSDKKDIADWQIIFLSHLPLNVYTLVLTVLEAYHDGVSGSVSITTNGIKTNVSYDFTNKERGEIIANVHGHNHNFLAKKVGVNKEWLWKICTPNIDVTRNNEVATSIDESWRNSFGEFDDTGKPVYYKKTQGTATSTSFCVFTIDRKNRKIHAIAYGAGTDRELDY